MGLLKDIKTQLKILESINENETTDYVKELEKVYNEISKEIKKSKKWSDSHKKELYKELHEEMWDIISPGTKSAPKKFNWKSTEVYKEVSTIGPAGKNNIVPQLWDIIKESVNEGLSTSDQQKVEKMFYAAKDKLGSRYNWKTHLTPIYHAISKKLKLNIDDVSGHLNLVGESVNECGECEEELEEASTTGGVAGYDTPNAFGDKSPASKKKRKKYSTSSTGYKMVKEASMYKRMISQMYKLNETSYRDYKKDPTSTPAQKVNRSIQEVNRMLGEIDKTVSHNLKLKLEAGVDASHFWKSTSRRFGKIGERLVKISNRIKELSQ